jgi:hypothetical protein
VNEHSLGAVEAAATRACELAHPTVQPQNTLLGGGRDDGIVGITQRGDFHRRTRVEGVAVTGTVEQGVVAEATVKSVHDENINKRAKRVTLSDRGL